MPKLSFLIYETTVDTEEDLIARILGAREAIEYRPRIFKCVSSQIILLVHIVFFMIKMVIVYSYIQMSSFRSKMIKTLMLVP